MSDDTAAYDPHTVLAQMMIDIYASPRTGEVTILHDKVFAETFNAPLVSLELNLADKSLTFIFKDTRRDLGVPLRDALVPYFRKAKQVAFFQIDMETKTPLHGTFVPILTKKR